MAGGGVGEMLVSVVVKEVASKLGSAMWEQIGLHWGFKNDMKEMKNNLEMVGAVLEDAEKKSIRDKPVCIWLKELKSFAYDLEDVMCNFETKIPSNIPGDGWGEKLRQIIYAPKVVKKRVDIANQMKCMRKRLGEIAERRSQFGLNTGYRFDKEVIIKERETFSNVNEETSIIGREREKTQLLSWLMESNGQDVSIISIVGLGGIGKTTLAQLLYNDERVKEEFNQQGWAYVSMELDLKNIARALIESFGQSSQIPNTLEGMYTCLKDKITGRKSLIVLDDLWEEDGGKLEELRGMLRWGLKGSKIIITTRNEKVSMLIQADQVHKLEVLSDDHCWNLFFQRAFISESEKNNNELLMVGREIVKKCGGIPLAAKALGYTMRLKKGIDAWSEVRDSDIWKLEDQGGSSSKTNIIPSLKLSYYFMPSYLKLCFAYCSIFPKGCIISKNELIHQWIALGFIQHTHEGFSNSERCGEEYVDNLLDMSFFQYVKRPCDKETRLCMHDLVHDLARSITGDELLVLDAKKDFPSNIGSIDHRYALLLKFMDLREECQTWSNKIRALHIHSTSRNFFSVPHMKPRPGFIHSASGLLKFKNLQMLDISKGAIEFLPINSGLSNLRYLNLHNCYNLCSLPDSIGMIKQLVYLNLSCCKSLRVIPPSFGNLHKLSWLELQKCKKLEVLPESFGKLINLRYLDMSDFLFMNLPEFIGNLINLQVLKFEFCSKLEVLPNLNLVNLQELHLKNCESLRKLPDSIGNLTKLQILDVSFCKILSITPAFIGIISNLRKLDMEGSLYPLSLHNFRALPTSFVLVREYFSDFYDIIELNQVKALHIKNQRLEIAGLENASNSENSAKAGLCTKLDLQYLTLTWTYPHNRSSEEMARDKTILDRLTPHACLKCLTINGYSSLEFPDWVMNIGYLLPNLSSVYLTNMETCDHLPPLGQLPNLCFLLVCNMPNLMKLDKAFFGGRGAFRRLESLFLDSLLELEEWPTKLPDNGDELAFTNLEFLRIRNCPKLRFEPSIPGIKNLSINKSPHIFSSMPSQRSVSLTLTDLKIDSCDELETLPDIIQWMTSLKTLKIECCKNLTTLPEWMGKLTSLENLSISKCDCLDYLPQSLFQLDSMKALFLYSCNQMLVEQCLGGHRFDVIVNDILRYQYHHTCRSGGWILCYCMTS